VKESLKVASQPSIRSEPAWLNRNVVGIGLTSLLSDAGHEMATAILPGFFAVLGIPAAALGVIEGVADAVSSFVKLGAGWASDRLPNRKPLVIAGYTLTGLATPLIALAQGWPLVLVARVVGWFGRGGRSAPRNALLAESVPPEARGRAFGFERAGDTTGAILGPLLAVGLLAQFAADHPEPSTPFRWVFLLTVVPGLGAALTFTALVRETRRTVSPPKPQAAALGLPPRFRRFLWGVGAFGMGDFSHTLMILAATQLLAPTRGQAGAAGIAGLLYVVHNVFYAASAYPVGALSDRWSRSGLLTAGYVLGTATALGLAAAFHWNLTSVVYLGLLFALGGVYVAMEEALEAVITADLVGAERRGTAFGITGTVNGVGDFAASALVGALWTALSPQLAFAAAAGLMLAGTVMISRLRLGTRQVR